MEWSTPSKPTVWQPDTDVTSRLCRSRYSRSSSFSRAKNHITPNIKTRPPAKPGGCPPYPSRRSANNSADGGADNRQDHWEEATNNVHS
jgi:hypothetical protein